MCSLVNAPIEQQARADTAAESHGQRILHASRGAKTRFAPHCGNRIIFHFARQSEKLTEVRLERNPIEI